MRLFHVQDSDAPAYVLALDWHGALVKWREWLAAWHGISPEETAAEDPQGIQLVADERELIT